MNKLLDRVSGRALAIVLAVLLGAIATISLSDYVEDQRAEAVAEAELVNIYFTNRDILPGVTVEAAISAGVFVLRPIPRESLPASAVTDLSTLAGLVIATPMYAGEPLQTQRFAAVAAETTAFTVPEGQVAMAVDLTATAGVANFIDPGDRVSVIAHFAEGPTGPFSQLLLQNVEILAIGRRITAGTDNSIEEKVERNDEQLTVTFALSPSDAEKLTFAQFQASLYLVRLPDAEQFSPANTAGRNAQNLFGR